MKTKITTIVFILFMSFLKAQSVGVGTATPDASTKIEIEDSQRGILIPRVSLTNVNLFGLAGNTQTEGILVYNINASIAGGNGKGFYYWNGAKWESLKSSSSANTNNNNIVQQLSFSVQFSATANTTVLKDVTSNPSGDTIYLHAEAGSHRFHQYVLNPLSGLYDLVMAKSHGNASSYVSNAVYMNGKLFFIAGLSGNNSVYQLNPTNFSANALQFTTVGATLGTKLISDGTYLYSNSSVNGSWNKFTVVGNTIVSAGTIALPSDITDSAFDGTNSYLISDTEISNWTQNSIYSLGDMGGLGIMIFPNNRIAYIYQQTLDNQVVHYTINIVGKP